MSSEWQKGKLGDFIELKRGYDLPQAKREKGVVPLISSSGHSDMHSVAMVKGPGVVTGRYGTIGQVFYVEGDFWPLNTTLYVRDFKGNSPKFISYFLKTLDFLAYSDKAAVPGINRNHLHEANVLLPKVEIQIEISKFLGTLDDRIALLRETNSTLESIAQALFKSWFVDFDPVHANAGTQAPSLPSEIQSLFPSTFVESPLGLVPEGWGVEALSKAYEINPTRKLKKGELAPYLDMASLGTSGHVCDEAILREMGSGTKFINGDTLLARITPCLENGKTAFVDFLQDEQVAWGSTEFVILRPKTPLPNYHAYLLARFPLFREYAIQSMSGTSGRQRIQNDVLGSFQIVIPDQDIAIAFGDIVSEVQQKIRKNHDQTQTLSSLRDTLLPRLISGQLRLPEVGEQFEAVLG